MMRQEKYYSSIPKLGEEFELASGPIEAKEVLRWGGYDPEDEDWKYNGRLFVPGTRVFKLVQTGRQPNIYGVRRKQGIANVPQGHWIIAFEKAYPIPDELGPIGIAYPFWVNSEGGSGFPITCRASQKRWDRDIIRAGGPLEGYWRWLQVCG